MNTKAIVIVTTLLVGAAMAVAFYVADLERAGSPVTPPPSPPEDPFASLRGDPEPPKPADTGPRNPRRPASSDRTPDVPGDEAPAPPEKPSGDAVSPPSNPPSSSREDPAPPRGLAVVEATLCRKVDRGNRKPVGATDMFRVRDGRIWCFMKLTGGANRKVRTIWHLGGRRYTGIWLKAGAPKAVAWRTWAYKNIQSTMTGSGRVEIVDEKNTILLTLPVQIKS
jgi:hypothetical protein